MTLRPGEAPRSRTTACRLFANKHLARDLRAPERIPLADIVRWRQGNSAMLGDKSIPCAVRYSGVWLMRGIALAQRLPADSSAPRTADRLARLVTDQIGQATRRPTIAK
jgi:hypothetical protein